MTARDFTRKPWLIKLMSVLAMAAMVFAIAGCGSSDDEGDESADDSAKAASIAGVFNQEAADKVPQKIRDRGSLIVATDATYAPSEFMAEDGKTIIGMDPDLAAALGTTLGLEIELKNATFDSIIPGLDAGKFDIAMSSFTDTKEREKKVDMVTYMVAGTGFYTNADDPTEVDGLSDLCGLKVAVQKATTQQDDVEAQNKKCADDKQIDLKVFTLQTDVDLAISSGKAQVAMADSPVAQYAVKQSDGKLVATGKDYDSAPYGIAVSKQSGMTDAVHAAMQTMMDNGTYGAILEKWGLSAGAIKTSKINDGV